MHSTIKRGSCLASGASSQPHTPVPSSDNCAAGTCKKDATCAQSIAFQAHVITNKTFTGTGLQFGDAAYRQASFSVHACLLLCIFVHVLTSMKFILLFRLTCNYVRPAYLPRNCCPKPNKYTAFVAFPMS